MLRNKIKKILIFSTIFMISLFPLKVEAKDVSLDLSKDTLNETSTPKTVIGYGGAVLTGDYSKNFSISFDNDGFFKNSLINPGDSWISNIKVKNNTGREMEVSLKEIVNNLVDDPLLFDKLQLKITVKGKTIYEGPYNGTKEPITDWIKIKPNETINFEVYIEFPGESGNEYQGKEMNSTWIFEARILEDRKPDNPNNPNNPIQTGKDGFNLILLGTFVVSGSICFILLRKNKKNKTK